MYNKPKVNKSGNKRGLARKGSKNLKKTDGGFENQYGVTFTAQEKKTLENKVNSAMAKRRKLMNERNSDIRTIFGVKQNYTVKDDFVSNDFLFAKKSKSLNNFKSKQQYETYIKNLERVNSKDYIDYRINRYKTNYIVSIRSTFGADGGKAEKKIKSMSTKDFAKLMNSELYAGIQYIYSHEDYQTKLEGLNAILGVE